MGEETFGERPEEGWNHKTQRSCDCFLTFPDASLSILAPEALSDLIGFDESTSVSSRNGCHSCNICASSELIVTYGSHPPTKAVVLRGIGIMVKTCPLVCQAAEGNGMYHIEGRWCRTGWGPLRCDE